MTLQQLQIKIASTYDENDANFAEKANKMMDDYFSKLPKSSSKTDPNRLGTRNTFASRLRSALIERAGPMEVDLPAADKEFNKMDVKEQLRFQARSRMAGINKWAHDLEIIPPNLAQLGMPSKQKQALFDHRAHVDEAKLQAPIEEVDCNKLIDRLCPALTLVTAKRHEIVAALLLVTGRRQVEIIKTGDIALGKGMDSNGYECIFSGQAKAGVFGDQPYAIPLLAPYWLVREALTKIRKMYDAKDMTTEDCNQSFSNAINKATKTRADLTPHQLRTVYALSTYQLADKKPSLIGWIKRVLGHSQSANAAYYQRMQIKNAGIWTSDRVDEPEEEDDEEDEDGWIVKGVVEKKRLAGIREMMEHKIRLTASSIRSNAGGTMAVAARIIANNREKIDEYNASLED